MKIEKITHWQITNADQDFEKRMRGLLHRLNLAVRRALPKEEIDKIEEEEGRLADALLEKKIDKKPTMNK